MKSDILRALALPAIAFFLLAGTAAGQFDDLLKQTPLEEVQKSGEELAAQLDTWEQEAKTQLERLERMDPQADLPEGISPADYSARRRFLEQILLGIVRQRSNQEGIATAAGELAEMEKTRDLWSGFEPPPPYSILMVDELLSRKESVAEKAASHQSSIDIFLSNLDNLLAQWKSAGEEVSTALEAYQSEGADKEIAMWAVETARAKQRSISVRISSLQANVASLELLKKTDDTELSLLSRQLKEAGKKTVFDKKDLAEIAKASADRQASLRREISEIRVRQNEAERDRAYTAEELKRLAATGTADEAALALATLKSEAAATRADSLQMMVETLEAYSQLEAFIPEAYEHRHTLLTGKSATERGVALDSLIALNKRLEAWEIVARNELSSVVADINRQESRTTRLPADDARLVPLTEQRGILWEKQALIQRAYQSVTSQRGLLARWIADHQKRDKPPWYSPVTSLFGHSLDSVKRIWNIPVTKIKETTEIDGQTVEQLRYVTLGTTLTAIVLFIFAYFIAAKISRRAQWVVVHRGVIGENQARTLRNWTMLIVALLLALATLSWLSIPLTVFAFLAGALAIGVGFGTQTIIKNFISGIILLFERKVRVGDIIEVDGTLGVVSEINTRSSIVRGFNGIENLIPNALFLENRVVNWTLNSRFLRRELALGVAYGSPPQKVIGILIEAAERHGLILKDPAPFAVFKDFGANSMDFKMYFWVELNDKTNGLIVDSDLRIMIEKRFAEAGIEVPFPQRDIHLASRDPMQIEIVGKS